MDYLKAFETLNSIQFAANCKPYEINKQILPLQEISRRNNHQALRMLPNFLPVAVDHIIKYKKHKKPPGVHSHPGKLSWSVVGYGSHPEPHPSYKMEGADSLERTNIARERRVWGWTSPYMPSIFTYDFLSFLTPSDTYSYNKYVYIYIKNNTVYLQKYNIYIYIWVFPKIMVPPKSYILINKVFQYKPSILETSIYKQTSMTSYPNHHPAPVTHFWRLGKSRRLGDPPPRPSGRASQGEMSAG